ncbi:hypothetical protein [Kibdelosporangium phytohabitans]|uniref:MftR C-terminal domain-containing protein n=1 Tax=Kibdelosporangium phytohabitans TaxID=860235 RepID=A0A0N9I1V7_9PSEU|nr:hypothetical protein [Kibdelosporangium phytohabitans]ALG08427.1 hypothetical protein AOZ06_17240 [Kibdelosporangium phytohabitans]MBE1470524.1 hypothetical protein [Kibdelosporangium phytohabitans]
MWIRHEDPLRRAIAAEVGVTENDPRCAALAHFTLEASALARQADDPDRALDAAFDLLANGWETRA